MTAEKWDIDLSHSSVGFWVRHLMVSKVHGKLGKFAGTVVVDDADPTKSQVAVEMEAASIETKDDKRDAHLKSADFLDVEKHPKLTFKSTSVEKTGKDTLKLKGDLTIKGVTRPVVLDVEYAGRQKDPWGGERAGFSATGVVNREEFGLTWNMALEAGGVLVSDKITLQIELEVVKQKA